MSEQEQAADDKQAAGELVEWVKSEPQVAAYEIAKLRRRVKLLEQLWELGNA